MTVHTALTIGFTRHSVGGGPFWTIIEHGARERARELGASLFVRYCTNDSESTGGGRARYWKPC